MVLFQVLPFTLRNDEANWYCGKYGKISKQTYVNYFKVMPKRTLQTLGNINQ
jgi:hypothetical protein